MNHVHTVLGGDGVATIVLDRPPANALTAEMFGELTEAFRGLVLDPSARVAVLASAVADFFSGGIDVKEAAAQTPELRFDRTRAGRGCYEAIRDCPVPVIAAVDGHAVGAGCALSLTCDIVVASEKASFGLPEINVGVIGGASTVLPLLPRGVVALMLFTGEPIDAADAHRHGMVQRLVPAGEARSAALNLARTIAQKHPQAMRLMKHTMQNEPLMSWRDASRFEQAVSAMYAESTDAASLRQLAADRLTNDRTTNERFP